MGDTTRRSTFQAEVEQWLPSVLQKSDEDLAVEIGKFALSDEIGFRPPSRERLIRAAMRLYGPNSALHSVLCEAANKELVGDALTSANIAAVAALIIPVLGPG